MERLLGLDIGTKRIGVAVGDDMGIVVSGKEAIPRRPELAAVKRIDAICDEYGIKKIVIGIPFHANGDFGEQAKDCKKFSELLNKDKYEIFYEDERCSSFAAEENLKERGVNFRKNKELIDIESACIILKQFINRK